MYEIQILGPENDHAHYWLVRTDFDNELNESPEISFAIFDCHYARTRRVNCLLKRIIKSRNDRTSSI